MKYLFIFMIFTPSFAFAAWEPADGFFKINEIVIEGSGEISRIYLRISPSRDPGECSNVSGGNLVRLEPSASTVDSKGLLIQQLYSAALTAYTAGLPVRLKMAGCDDWARPKAIAVWLK